MAIETVLVEIRSIDIYRFEIEIDTDEGDWEDMAKDMASEKYESLEGTTELGDYYDDSDMEVEIC